MSTRFYECRYVRRGDPGDLLWGYHWRPAILIEEGDENLQFERDDSVIEERMFDKETGANVGDTRNYCINPVCNHEDCAPMTLIAEVE